MAAKPLPTVPVILDTTPAAPPEGTGHKAKVMRFHSLRADNTQEAKKFIAISLHIQIRYDEFTQSKYHVVREKTPESGLIPIDAAIGNTCITSLHVTQYIG